MAVIGATGSGKSSLFLNLFAQDVARGDGVLYIDPLGDDAERAIDLIPRWRRNQVCYLNFADRAHPIALNILEDTAPDDRERLADNALSAMRAIWLDIGWGARMEEILRHALLALIETPGASLALLPRLLTDDRFRARIVPRLNNPLTRTFFGVRFERWRDAYREEAINPVLNKVETFLFSPIIRNVFGQSSSTLHFTHAMQHRRIIVVNLAKGVIGETAAHLAGALIVARVQSAGLERLNSTTGAMPDFHVLIDEAQDIVTDVIPALYSQARHYGVTLALATQYLAALTPKTRAALRANPAILVTFRPAADDAELLALEYNRLHQSFNPAALLALGLGQAAVRVAGHDARFVQFPPPPAPIGDANLVRQQSRRHYARAREQVEKRLEQLLAPELPERNLPPWHS